MAGHGWRAVARALLDEALGFPTHLIEHQLAHQVRDPLGRAYTRPAHLPERRVMMQARADCLDRLRAGAREAKVVELARKRRGAHGQAQKPAALREKPLRRRVELHSGREFEARDYGSGAVMGPSVTYWGDAPGPEVGDALDRVVLAVEIARLASLAEAQSRRNSRNAKLPRPGAGKMLTAAEVEAFVRTLPGYVPSSLYGGEEWPHG